MVKPAEHLESPVTLLKPRGVAITIFLPQSIHEHLKNLAVQNERSLSGEARWALKSYCEDPTAFDGG